MHDDPSEQDGPLDDFDGLGSPVKDDGVGLDDEPAPNSCLEPVLDQPASIALPEQEQEALDVGALLPSGTERPSSSDDDAPGLPSPEAIDPFEPPSLGGSLAADLDATDQDPEWLGEQLPPLELDEDGASPEEERWQSAGDPRDEPLPEPAELVWHERPLCHANLPCQALALGLGVVVAAGEQLLWLAGSAASPTLLPGRVGQVQSLVLVGQTRQYVLCATVRGALIARRPDGSSELWETWRELAGPDPERLQGLELCQLGDDCPPIVLGRTTSGALLRSTRGGSDWHRVHLPGRVLALSACGSPVVAVGDVGGKNVLWRSEDLGTSFVEVALSTSAQAVVIGECPLICAIEECVALAHPERGLVVSADGGQSFRRVPGCAGATALAAGQLEGKPTVFAALLLEGDDRTELVVVDPSRARAERVGTQAPPAAGVEGWDASLERARTSAMRWDADSRCLWLAGSFGLTSWFPPRATDA
jgi:hypothetical protein